VSFLLVALEPSAEDNHRVVSGDFPFDLDKTSDVFALNITVSDSTVEGG
jgi:hypothetical protein